MMPAPHHTTSTSTPPFTSPCVLESRVLACLALGSGPHPRPAPCFNLVPRRQQFLGGINQLQCRDLALHGTCSTFGGLLPHSPSALGLGLVGVTLLTILPDLLLLHHTGQHRQALAHRAIPDAYC